MEVGMASLRTHPTVGAQRQNGAWLDENGIYKVTGRLGGE